MDTNFSMSELEPKVQLFHSAKKFCKTYEKYAHEKFDKDLSKYDGMTTTGRYKDQILTLVYIRNDKKYTLEEDYAILAHEATHIKQCLMEMFGEKNPGRETEALIMEILTKYLMRAHCTWLKKKGIKKGHLNE